MQKVHVELNHDKRVKLDEKLDDHSYKVAKNTKKNK